jgi:hypothetical protein
MMPIPTHLKGLADPTSDVVDEEPLHADLKCDCGSSKFEVAYPGQTHEWNGEQVPCTAQIGDQFFFLVEGRCSVCEKGYCVVDQDFHGWNGFVCHDPAQAKLQRPVLEPWNCKTCGHHTHCVSIDIQTRGREDFIEEAGDDFDPDCWPDAFSWIDINLTCCDCSKKSPSWVSLETM